MTPFNVCPTCVRLNLPDTSICSTCGATLRGTMQAGAEEHSEAFVDLTQMELDADTTPSVHLDAPELQRWLNSRTGGLDAPRAQTHEPDTPLPPLTLREFETPLPCLPPDHQPATPALPSRGSAAPAVAPRNLSPIAKAAAKALRRAQVRRSVQANKGQPEAAAAPADVLVLEGDDAAREQLCTLLEAFGFRTHPVQSTVQAVGMLAAKRYAVALLNIIFDGSAALASHDLCSRFKAPPTHASDALCVLIVVTDAARPLERVRAELAGCDAFLHKPVSRGTLAQALEACGVALPIDARRV